MVGPRPRIGGCGSIERSLVWSSGLTQRKRVKLKKPVRFGPQARTEGIIVALIELKVGLDHVKKAFVTFAPLCCFQPEKLADNTKDSQLFEK